MEIKSVSEAARETPVRAQVDVLIAGGGLGGVSAALAAARTGAKTLLIERNGFLGGVATAGMCCSVFNCYYTADHRLGITGNAVEVTDALADATGYGKKWHNQMWHIQFLSRRNGSTPVNYGQPNQYHLYHHPKPPP